MHDQNNEYNEYDELGEQWITEQTHAIYFGSASTFLQNRSSHGYNRAIMTSPMDSTPKTGPETILGAFPTHYFIGMQHHHKTMLWRV